MNIRPMNINMHLQQTNFKSKKIKNIGNIDPMKNILNEYKNKYTFRENCEYYLGEIMHSLKDFAENCKNPFYSIGCIILPIGVAFVTTMAIIKGFSNEKTKENAVPQNIEVYKNKIDSLSSAYDNKELSAEEFVKEVQKMNNK